MVAAGTTGAVPVVRREPRVLVVVMMVVMVMVMWMVVWMVVWHDRLLIS